MGCIDCKAHINSIIETFTGDDKLIRTICIGPRKKTDKHYNSVSILAGDDNIVKGKYGDGKIGTFLS